MKLYVNESRTQWAGTQADAKKELGKYEAFDVPVDKSGLLAFLNKEAGFNIDPVEVEQQPVVTHQRDTPPRMDTLVGRTSLVDLKELSTILQVLINKTWSEQEQKEVLYENKNKN
jgi:hypothetical protein